MTKITKTSYFTYFILSIAAVLYICGFQAFMHVANVLSSELDAVPLVITLLKPELSPYYGILYLAVNVPIILIFYRKVSKTFIWRTIYVLLFSTAFSTIFFIPGVSEVFHTAFIHSKGADTDLGLKETVTDDIWPMLVLALIGGAVIGTAMALSWKFGGSTGGADVIIYYISTKKKKPVGVITFVVSMIILSITFCVMISIDKEIRKVWLASIIGSFIYVAVISLVINRIFPKYSKVLVEIHSGKTDIISAWLKKNHAHPFRLGRETSGYTAQNVFHISTVILVLESKEFIRKIKEIDPMSWISTSPISDVHGRFNTKAVDH